MEINEYQEKVASFYVFPRFSDTHHAYAVFNLVGELGELFSLSAKAYRDGPADDHDEKVVKELGDLLFMIACFADSAGLTLNDVAEANIAKLEARKSRGTIKGSGDDR